MKVEVRFWRGTTEELEESGGELKGMCLVTPTSPEYQLPNQFDGEWVDGEALFLRADVEDESIVFEVREVDPAFVGPSPGPDPLT